MNKIFYILISIILFSCEEESDSNPTISNSSNMNIQYKIDLNWNQNEERLKTGVNIQWKKWIDNPLLTFIKYEIQDVSTEQTKWIDFIEQIEDTSYQVEFPTGTFYRLCVLAHYYNTNSDSNEIISSDSIQFFTQPLSSIENLVINPEPLETTINWDSSDDQSINKLIIYRGKILNEVLNLSNVNAPNINRSMISNNTGEIQDSIIYYNDETVGVWQKIYEGTNLDILYNDTDPSDPNYAYYYTINVKIEDNDTEIINETVIANYRYSLIVPQNEDGKINEIENQTISLLSDPDQENIIILHWNSYSGDDFYSYEIWRTDIESTDIESLENSGQKIVEITTQTQDFFEDISLVGSEKTFYYFIRVNNNYGYSIESNIVEGDTTL